MFLFQNISGMDWLVWGLVVIALMVLNEAARANKWALIFPPAILAFNIMEAVIRDFQVSHLHGLVDGVIMNGGAWNIMNGIAGIINIITISGWFGIITSHDKQKDMIWPDQIWPWIIAYDV